MKRYNPLILGAALVVALIAGLLLWNAGDLPETKGTSGAAGQAQGSGVPTIGGPFTLTDESGKKVTDRDFAGQYMLVYFGFTSCPDVCPTELQAMTAALTTLGPKGDKIVPVFITVDPERDTPQVLGTYVKQFSPRLKGLVGTPDELAAVAKEYKVFYEKVKDDTTSGDYTMDHSSVVYLMGPDGKFLTFFGPGTTPDEMAAKIKTLM
ncbi:MAG: SCO family protein [Parvibaculaceae bacterium]